MEVSTPEAYSGESVEAGAEKGARQIALERSEKDGPRTLKKGEGEGWMDGLTALKARPPEIKVLVE